jgi:outer membrane lipoprotein-sorting protein
MQRRHHPPTRAGSAVPAACFAAIALTIVAAVASPTFAQATQPAAQGDEAAFPDTSQRAQRWLQRIEKRADRIDGLKAKLRYDRVKGLLGSKQRRFGTLTYQAGDPPRFAVHFNKLLEGNTARDQNRWYMFDGRWLAEKRADEKIFIRRELVPAGEKRDVLQMGGQGPFVLALDQDKQHVLNRFRVKVIAEQDDDPPNTIHLRLTPRPDREIDLTQVDLWYDKDSLLPQRAVTVKGEGGAQNKSIVTLLEVDTDMKVDASVFDTTPPNKKGWDVEIKRLQRPARR